MAARALQMHRFERSRCRTNSEMTSDETKEFCEMSASTERFAVAAADKMQLSARGYYRMLKVARTIADLRASVYGSNAEAAKKAPVECSDIAEALRYRAFSGLNS